MPKSEKFQQLPAPWDRLFALFTRLFVWGLLIAILYILRPFFLLIFLTFVFAYIQSHAVEGLAHRFANRAYRVTIVFLIFLGVIVGTLYFLAPHVRNQMEEFTSNHERYIQTADIAIYKWIDRNPGLKQLLHGEPKKDGTLPQLPARPEDRPPIIKPFVIGLLKGSDSKPPKPVESSEAEDLTAYGDILLTIIGGITGITSSFLLSILFSFLIVLDLPSLSRSLRGLANTKLDFIYDEVADNIHQFGKRVGRALEAQLIIAVCNTIFTAIGIYFLELPSIVFLSTIVFFCSFIPVAGVFISSAPICLLCLQTGGANGVQLMLIAIALILVIHAIEAYILNPKIYGHHLRMNSVLVLIVLTIAGKIVGVWGLVLGLPVMQYIFTTAIRRSENDVTASGVVPAVQSSGVTKAVTPPPETADRS